ncbi:MAG: iron ABC transporter permease [Chloroflexi bacterium]|nr:iron ABC transporter permease [Chloroflexota bacterium]
MSTTHAEVPQAQAPVNPLRLTSTQQRLALRVAVIILGALIVLGGMAYNLTHGNTDDPLEDVITILRGEEDSEIGLARYIIVNNQRYPRVLLAGLVGVNLAVAGVMLQGVVRSPMGDPYILGVSAGAGLTSSYILTKYVYASPHTVSAAAFGGALAGTLLVYLIAWDGSGTTTTRLVLTGVALTTMLGIMTTSIIVMNVQGGGQIYFQRLVGGLYGKNIDDYYQLAPWTIGGLVAALVLARQANILALGDDVARGLGLHVERTRFLMAVAAAILAGSAVAVVGMIAFVGLIVPVFVRLVFGSDYRIMIPANTIFGAALVIWADALARLHVPGWLGEAGNEFISVGIVTGVIGGPLFLWMVRARRMQW